jgi:hypothetical protein
MRGRYLCWALCFCALLLLSLTSGIRHVLACTMGPIPPLEEIVSTTMIVQARVIESDIARQNYVLQVERYLTGEAGSEFLLLTTNSPNVIQGIIDTNLGGGDCN